MTGIILNIATLLFFPFLFIGIINRIKSLWSGRKGPRLFQSLYDMVKLLKKGKVTSTVSGPVFSISPAILLASVSVAGLTVPMFGFRNVIGFNGDFIVFAYFLALGRFFSVVSAMDTGSSFSGMGASREAAYSALLEPAFFIILASISSMSGFFSFHDILTGVRYDGWISILIKLLCIVSFVIIVLTEGSRVPVDDPNTHLELTMIHEAMILDNSGPDLGIIGYATGMKMTVIASIIVNFMMPSDLDALSNALLFVLALLVIPVLVGFIESFMARLRLVHIPQFILLVTSISMIILSVIQFSFSGAF
jgi:formate hydrogenlyase subunit 4